MGKLGTFIAGAVTGVVGLGIAAFLVDKYDNSYGSNYHYSNDDDDDSGDNSIDIDTNENAGTETCAESSPLFNKEQTAESSAINPENKNSAESLEKFAETIVKAMAPAQTAQGSN